MNVSRTARYLAALLATLNWVVPVSQLPALEPPSQRPTVVEETASVPVNDVVLAPGGQLRGLVLNLHGQPADSVSVMVVQNGKQVASVTPDKQGRFLVPGLRGGVFQVSAGKNTYLCRGWVAGTEPPIARKQLLIVPDGVLERGQRPFGDLFFADPVMLGLVIAAAVAIPIAVSNSRKDSPAGS